MVRHDDIGVQEEVLSVGIQLVEKEPCVRLNLEEAAALPGLRADKESAGIVYARRFAHAEAYATSGAKAPTLTQFDGTAEAVPLRVNAAVPAYP